MEIEHVARIGFAARRAAQQQRHLAIGDGLLGQIVDRRSPRACRCRGNIRPSRSRCRARGTAAARAPTRSRRRRWNIPSRHSLRACGRSARRSSASGRSRHRCSRASCSRRRPALTPFWLMKVSIATADLPVWRSPMISSRWPRPTGTSASIALRPVCTGSCTDLRGMMPGAFTSTRLRWSATIGPLPSIGLPRPSTTRPSRPLPTGTSTMVPVRLTMSPSLISASEPKITTPTLSASRLSAMPCTPLANSTISPAWTLSRPWMRAMPSPTDSTWPTSETCGLGAEVGDLVLDDLGDFCGADIHV